MDSPGWLTVTLVKRPATSTVRRLPTDPAPAALVETSVAGCHFEVQRQSEDTELTTINTEVAWFFLPPTPLTLGITATDSLRFGGREYKVQGPAVVEYFLDGEASQVRCMGRWEQS